MALYAYRSDGTFSRCVEPDWPLDYGEVQTFPDIQTPAQLAAAFPSYTNAAQIQTLQQQIAALQAQIDALDGGFQARQMRTMLIATGGGDPTSLAKLQALEASIVATGLRAQISTLQAQLNTLQ